MTTLVIEELKTTLSQTLNITSTKRVQLVGVRPYIYMHNEPVGTFTLSLKDDTSTLATQTFTSAEIKTDLITTDSYAHLFKRIVFADPIQLGMKSYTLELSSVGYTFSEASYLGWVKEHENQFNETNGTPLSAFDNPLSFQLFSYVEAR